MEPTNILKSSGESEEFSAEKIIKSITRAGGKPELAEKIEKEIETKPEIAVSTDRIHEYVLGRLKESDRPLAARYNLRRAVSNLGPSGYPFEKFVSEIFKKQGFQVEINMRLEGKCIPHEVDVVVYYDTGEAAIVEAKFHTKPGLKSGVQVPLYVHSRFRDLEDSRPNPEREHIIKSAWIVTNTKFSKDALTYANCNQISALGWNYPRGRSLRKLIDQLEVHPITALTSLSDRHLQLLIDNGIVLISQIGEGTELLHKAGMSSEQVADLLYEAEAVRELGHDQAQN